MATYHATYLRPFSSESQVWSPPLSLPEDPTEWPVIDLLPSYGRGRERLGGRHNSLIHGDGLRDVVITDYKMPRQQAAQHSSTGPVVEPRRIPDPPATWYPRGSVLIVSTRNTGGPSSSQDGDTVEDRPMRGPSCPNGPWGRDGGKLSIIMNKFEQPIMEAHSTLATRLGVLARDGMFVPLNYYDWRYVPDHCKMRIKSRLQQRRKRKAYNVALIRRFAESHHCCDFTT